jgi:hypothetical protein
MIRRLSRLLNQPSSLVTSKSWYSVDIQLTRGGGQMVLGRLDGDIPIKLLLENAFKHV